MTEMMNTKVPEKVKAAQRLLANLNPKKTNRKQAEDFKIAEAKLILAVYGCQQEGVPVTVTNLIMILKAEAPSILQFITPELYGAYGIIGP